MADTSHVFIVGLPRTGSTLARGMLNQSGQVWVAGESRYLWEPTRFGLVRRRGYADEFARRGDIATDEGLERVLDYIYALRGKSFWSRLAGQADRQELTDAFRSGQRTREAFLDTAMAHFAKGRPIRGEKTPHHIHHVATLLSWYPNARVIHTFRDPRAVYLSLRRKEKLERLEAPGRVARRLGVGFDLYALGNLVHRWRWMARLHRSYLRRFPERYHLVRFEDLVGNPHETAVALARFVGVPFADAMLEQVVHNSSFAAKASRSGIDSGVADRWRDQITAREASFISRFCAADLFEFGYSRT